MDTLLQLIMNLKNAQIPIILLLAGIVCLVWGIVGELYEKIPRLSSHGQRVALIILGIVFLVVSVFLYASPVEGPPPPPATPTASVATPSLTFTSVPTSAPEPTAAPEPTTEPGQASFLPANASLVVSDPLQQNGQNAWTESSVCVFRGNTYHALNQTPNSPPNECSAQAFPGALPGQNLAIQVEMRILSGNYGGLGFGMPGGKRYYFSVNESHQYQVNFPGHGWFSCYQGPNGPQPQAGQPQTLCPTADYVPTQPIRLQLLIQGNMIRFFLNDHLDWVGPNVGISPGTVILLAGFFENNTDLAFQNLKIWRLP